MATSRIPRAVFQMGAVVKGLGRLALQGGAVRPFTSSMKVSPSDVGANYGVAVAKKQLDNVREQGQQALKLIEAASPAVPQGTGQIVNVVA